MQIKLNNKFLTNKILMNVPIIIFFMFVCFKFFKIKISWDYSSIYFIHCFTECC